MNELSGKINGIAARRTQLVKNRDDAQRAADAARKDADANSFWSGFVTGLTFGIYQADFYTKDLQRLEHAENQIYELDNEERNLNNELNNLKNAVETTKKEIASYERQIYDCSEQINAAKLKKLQYDDLIVFYGNTASTFKYTDTEVKTILKELSAVRGKLKNTGGI